MAITVYVLTPWISMLLMIRRIRQTLIRILLSKTPPRLSYVVDGLLGLLVLHLCPAGVLLPPLILHIFSPRGVLLYTLTLTLAPS